MTQEISDIKDKICELLTKNNIPYKSESNIRILLEEKNPDNLNYHLISKTTVEIIFNERQSYSVLNFTVRSLDDTISKYTHVNLENLEHCIKIIKEFVKVYKKSVQSFNKFEKLIKNFNQY